MRVACGEAHPSSPCLSEREFRKFMGSSIFSGGDPRGVEGDEKVGAAEQHI
jgi:hypothetical protein